MKMRKKNQSYDPLRPFPGYMLILKLLILFLRVPLRVILGKERRNEFLKSIHFYSLLEQTWASYLWGKENYEDHWGYINFDRKRILDVGADWGSTAQFFLMRGAKCVVAVEGNKQLYKQLVKNAKKSVCLVPIFLFVNTPKHFESLIKQFKPDLMKVDCDGCEIHLAGVDDSTFSEVKEYAIEVHSSNILNQIERKLVHNKYAIRYHPFKSQTVLLATKRL